MTHPHSRSFAHDANALGTVELCVTSMMAQGAANYSQFTQQGELYPQKSVFPQHDDVITDKALGFLEQRSSFCQVFFRTFRVSKG